MKKLMLLVCVLASFLAGCENGCGDNKKPATPAPGSGSGAAADAAQPADAATDAPADASKGSGGPGSAGQR